MFNFPFKNTIWEATKTFESMAVDRVGVEAERKEEDIFTVLRHYCIWSRNGEKNRSSEKELRGFEKLNNGRIRVYKTISVPRYEVWDA